MKLMYANSSVCVCVDVYVYVFVHLCACGSFVSVFSATYFRFELFRRVNICIINKLLRKISFENIIMNVGCICVL